MYTKIFRTIKHNPTVNESRENNRTFVVSSATHEWNMKDCISYFTSYFINLTDRNLICALTDLRIRCKYWVNLYFIWNTQLLLRYSVSSSFIQDLDKPLTLGSYIALKKWNYVKEESSSQKSKQIPVERAWMSWI